MGDVIINIIYSDNCKPQPNPHRKNQPHPSTERQSYTCGNNGSHRPDSHLPKLEWRGVNTTNKNTPGFIFSPRLKKWGIGVYGKVGCGVNPYTKTFLPSLQLEQMALLIRLLRTERRKTLLLLLLQVLENPCSFPFPKALSPSLSKQQGNTFPSQVTTAPRSMRLHPFSGAGRMYRLYF